MTDWQGRAIVNATAEAAGGAVKARVNAAAQELVAGLDGGVWRVPDVRVEAPLNQPAPDQGLHIAAPASRSGTFEPRRATASPKGAQLVVERAIRPRRHTGSRLEVRPDSTSSRPSAGDIRELKTRCMADLKANFPRFRRVRGLLRSQASMRFKSQALCREFHLVAPLAGGATRSLRTHFHRCRLCGVAPGIVCGGSLRPHAPTGPKAV
jgi:hypothetical protein